MNHLLTHSGNTMERFGLLGFIWVWLFNLFATIMNEQLLREVSLVMAILVSFATLAWYVGQFIINYKKFQQGRKDFLNEIKSIIKWRKK